MSEAGLVVQRQSPLRDLYRDDPSAAITVKRARTVPAPTPDPLHASVEVFGEAIPTTRWDIGVDAKVGGLDDLPNPGHLLCAALATCAESTLRMVAEHLHVGVEQLSVEVTGEVDCSGCLAIDATAPVGFRSIDVVIDLVTAAGTDERSAQLLRDTTERLCVVLDTLRREVPVDVSYVKESAWTQPTT